MFAETTVESNDTLYGGDQVFRDAITELRATIVDDILDYLKRLGDDKVVLTI